MKVLKFGGTSVSTPENINKVIEIVKFSLDQVRCAVVVSAFGGVTDQLLEAGKLAEKGDERYLSILNKIEQRHIDSAKQLVNVKRQSSVLANVKIILNELEDVLHGVFLVKEMTLKTQDFILSFGERISANIIAESFKENGIDANYNDSRELIKTDSSFGNAHVQLEKTYDLINGFFQKSEGLQVFPGFISSTDENETTTLGRGGSDYTASLIAAALGARELEIWTDVDGMMTIDPRKVEKAFPVPGLSYAEAMELSHFGAKVIYPPTIQPAFSKNIPIHIKNTFNPKAPGTVISKKSGESNTLIKGLSSIDSVSLLTLHGSGMIGVAGISMRLFTALASNNISVILISQASSEHSISVAISPADGAKAKKAVEKEFAPEIQSKSIDKVEIENELSIVAVVGEKMKMTRGIAGKLFSTLGRNGINVVAIAQGSSELNISFVIENRDLRKSLNVIHDSFFLSETRDLNLFIVGVGTIGKTLLNQIDQQFKYLADGHSLNVKIVGLANSKKMLHQEAGIAIGDWQKQLDKEGVESDIYKYIDKMIELNLPYSIFVDCTANEDIAQCYKKVLKSSISVVTPNKIACSGKLKYYNDLKDTAANKGVKFLYETNVCAGLPIISTLNDLIKSGDEIFKIETILSGTLNFIFNTYSKDVPFSQVVKIAQESGYSEPDPRIDLSGTDVARKILILARELGADIQPEEVKVDSFLPENCRKAKSLEDFYSELEKADAAFEEQRASLEQEGKKLKYVAVFENGKAYTALQAYDKKHAFYSVEGKDNIVLFSTARYKEEPMIVKGAGAGAEVTAAGVFADIIRIANL